jgi:hypothetical protein
MINMSAWYALSPALSGPAFRIAVISDRRPSWSSPRSRIERGGPSAFDTITRTDREVLLGTDAGHLNFRAGVLVEPDPDGTTITVATLAATRSRAGRAYLAVVRLVHPLVVRGMLRHAGRTTVSPWRVHP